VNARLGTDTVTLRATWAQGLDINMQWKPVGATPRGGPAMSMDVVFALDDVTWTVECDFGSEGAIRFRCNQLFVRLREPSQRIAVPGLLEWNRAVVDLVQVLWGVISPNMRLIVLKHDGQRWIFSFVLERDDERDREEIEEVPSEFEALQSGPMACDAEIRISDALLECDRPSERVIYRRRETRTAVS
jgi:hypothetical protein